MKRFLKYMIIAAVIAPILSSCRTDVIGGTINETNKFDMTTY